MSAEANTACVRRILEEAWSQGNLDLLDKLYATDCVEHDLSTHEELYGLDANKERVRTYRDAMPDLQVSVDDMIASGDRVVTRWRAVGTNEGDLMGNPPTHRHVEITGISIDRFDADGRVAETWDQWDLIGFMQQLGMAPATQASA
jgi:steroid delta-isomerase-like uncharacterized protein